MSAQRNQNRNRGGNQGRGKDVPSRQSAPYHFVPVEPTATVLGQPGRHDVLDLERLLTGELQITMTALTPLLAANDQYSFEQATPDVKSALEQIVKQAFGGKADKKIDPTKKILEPLTDSRPGQLEPGAVLIPGAALKGSVRQSLGALLAAPMERVSEREASYRPNIKTLGPKHNPIRDCVPALAIEGGGWNKEGANGVTFLVLKSLVGTVCFVHPDAVPHLPERIQSLIKLKEDNPWALADRYKTKPGRNRLALTQDEAHSIHGVGLSQANILKPRGPNSAGNLEGWLPVVNNNGIDLEGLLNSHFHKLNPELARELSTKSPQGYPLLFVNLHESREYLLENTRELRAFYNTLLHLADEDKGHLRAHPLLREPDDLSAIKKRIEEFRNRGLLPGDLVFFERSKQGKSVEYTTLGHHFYYRWRQRTTVHKTVNQEDAPPEREGVEPGLRDILCPKPLEREATPKQLSAARLLFGYVGTTKGEYDNTEPLTFGIGIDEKGEKTDHHQLAGRIAINMAVEQNADRKLSERFLKADAECLVPLRPLGMPRSSAVEHYLTQDRLALREDGGVLCTFGDTPGDNAVGQLRGRKFYLHQPDAAKEPGCYQLRGDKDADWGSGNNYPILSEQASVGRFISQPQTRFRFTMRYTNLAPWELGALLFVLQPTLEDLELLESKLPKNAASVLNQWLLKVEQKGWKNNQPLFAHKLGHARPLGLGSVTYAIDGGRQMKSANNRPECDALDAIVFAEKRKEYVAAFLDYVLAQPEFHAERWVQQCLVPWLQVHRYAGCKRFDYPRLRGKDGESIFEYHSALRAAHAEGRKRSKQPGSRERLGLRELDELDDAGE